MRCYCYETENDFLLCVEEVESAQLEDVILHAWFNKTDDNRFIKTYPMKNMDNGATTEDRALVKRNFQRLGQSMFKGMLDCDWANALSLFAQKCKDNSIEWYIFGSISEAVLGVDIKPHDIDIIVHTRDFYKIKATFPDYIVEPFVDNKGTWLVRYFGRLCFSGVLFDIAADDKMNLENHQYDKVLWNDYDVFVEPIQIRYQLELNRKRQDRIAAIEAYLKNGITERKEKRCLSTF